MNVRYRCLVVAAAFTLIAASSVFAAPWQMITFKKVEADPNKPYPLTDTNGPWMIMVTTFRGEDGEQRSHQLVLELRKSYKLAAFVTKKTFDYNDTGARYINPYGERKRMVYLNEKTYEEYVVLVGDYRSVDDPEGKKTLAMLKSAEPDCMKNPGKPNDNSFDKMRRQAEEMLTGAASKPRGPLAGAFITTNPLLPHDYYAPKGIDKFIVDLNKGIAHDLLDCKGRYTVKIATLTGHVEIDQRKISEMERAGNKDKLEGDDDPLVMATRKAHALTEQLRKDGIEAYEFHDRYSSIVTIGSFMSVGNPRPDGKTEINPQMYEIIQKYGQDPKKLTALGGADQSYCKSRTVTIDGKPHVVLLDVSPTPVEVPQRSIGADYQQTTMLR